MQSNRMYAWHGTPLSQSQLRIDSDPDYQHGLDHRFGPWVKHGIMVPIDLDHGPSVWIMTHLF